MGSTRQHNGELWVKMHARRLGLGRNPLRRRSDRLESVLLLLTVFAGLLLVPAAAALGSAVRSSSEQTAARERAVLRTVTAQTLEDTRSVFGVAPGQMTSRVRVEWQDAAGAPVLGWADVAVGTKIGTEVTVWLDRAGNTAKAPRPDGDSAALGGVVGLTTVMFGWLALYGVFLVAKRPLDRRRYDEIAREWEQVAARWNRNQR